MNTEEPKRLQRPKNGWRTKSPDGAVYVGPGSRWANPWQWRTRNALARVPALDGSPWEVETRISSAGREHSYWHPDGRITSHTVRYMTRAECKTLFERALLVPSDKVRLWRHDGRPLTVQTAREELAGMDLYCQCAPGRLCHADTLLWVANAPAAQVAVFMEEVTT